jgi:hypothetical protein
MTSAGGALFLGVMASIQGTNSAITPEAAFTTLQEEEDGSAHAAGNSCYRIVTTGTTDQIEWVRAVEVASCGVGVVYKEASEGGGGLNVDEQEWFTAERQTNRSVVSVW